jgi:hypothetical protein
MLLCWRPISYIRKFTIRQLGNWKRMFYLGFRRDYLAAVSERHLPSQQRADGQTETSDCKPIGTSQR